MSRPSPAVSCRIWSKLSIFATLWFKSLILSLWSTPSSFSRTNWFWDSATGPHRKHHRYELMSLFFDHHQPATTPGQVVIRSPSNPRELLYIEIQGEIKSTLPVAAFQSSNDPSNSDKRYLWDQELGTYEELEDGKTATLIIGNLKLVGTKEKLKKPFLMLSKQKQALPTPSYDHHSTESAESTVLTSTEASTPSPNQSNTTMLISETDEAEALEHGMAIIGVVNYIVRFSKRPIPLIKQLAQ